MKEPMAVADGGLRMLRPVVPGDDLRSRRLRRQLLGGTSIPGGSCGALQPVPVLGAASRIDAGDAIPANDASANATLHLHSFQALKEFVHDHFPWLELCDRSSPGFDADVTVYRVGGNLFSTVRTCECEAVRSRHLAEASQAGYIQVMWQLSSWTEGEQDGNSFRLEAGDVCVCDTARPYRIRLADRSRVAVLMLPSEAFPNWEHSGRRICGRRVAGSVATRAALGALMSLNNQPADVVASEGVPVVTAVKWMLHGTLLGDHATGTGEDPCDSLFAKARRHIVAHVSDPALGPDQIASVLCMSRRSLYLLFKAHRLTPSRLIHDIRLDLAMRALQDPGQSHQKMTHIAFDAGFADYATFSRLFKAHFGITPSAFRSAERLADPGPHRRLPCGMQPGPAA